MVSFSYFETLGWMTLYNRRIRFVKDSNYGSKTFFDPVELVLSWVVIDRFIRF